MGCVLKVLQSASLSRTSGEDETAVVDKFHDH